MIEFTLNGALVSTNSDVTLRLLDLLREEFGLNATKEGCGEGECGACSILVNGRIMNSCITAIGSINGANVVTLEGFKDTERYKLLEKTFAKAGAVQCGFCIPGMIMAAESLLSQKPTPSLDDIREGISGNLCRCTGYNMIIDAVMMAAKEGEGLW
jgi:carbon-monoxide dehydrogenase small subunit